MLLVMFYASLIIIQSVLHLVRFDVRQLTFYDVIISLGILLLLLLLMMMMMMMMMMMPVACDVSDLLSRTAS